MIYFMQAGKNGPIKIGDSDEIHFRLETLQVGCPYKLKLLFVYNGRHFNESQLHEFFKHEHIRGEWFRPAKAIKEFNITHSNDCYAISNFDLYKCREDYQLILYEREKYDGTTAVRRG
jgi:hypothetical protein